MAHVSLWQRGTQREGCQCMLSSSFPWKVLESSCAVGSLPDSRPGAAPAVCAMRFRLTMLPEWRLHVKPSPGPGPAS